MKDAPVRFGFLNERLRAAVRDEMDSGRADGEPGAGFYVSGESAWRYANSADASHVEARLGELAERVGLDRLETAVLALAVAPQLDPRYTKVFSYLHDSVIRALPSPRLIARLLAGPGLGPHDVLDCFAPERKLRACGCLELVDADDQRAPVDRPVAVAPEIGAFLIGAPVGDAERDPRVRRVDLPGLPLGRTAHIERLARYLSEPGGLPALVSGPDAPLLLAAAVGRGLAITSVKHLEDRALQRRVGLICALENRVHAHDDLEALEAHEHDRLVAVLDERKERTLLCVERRGAKAILGLVVDVPLPSLSERLDAWLQLTGSPECEDVAANFRLSIGQIAKASVVAKTEAAVNGREHPSRADLSHAGRVASATRLGELATRLDPVHTWEDLVLPPRQIRTLRSISAYLRQRERVLEEWGYARTVARNQGVKAMFAGESGTGKTMGAQVIARDLGLDIFRVDLATIVSKYIGETEKNLDRIFTAAEGSNAILFFDEADALFGKRSEVNDSHDRYANIEVAYLLQKMEGYSGAVILATNYKQNVDDAFLRRLDFMIVFPFPEFAHRRRIWELVLPDTAPLGPDVDLDFLAKQFRLSGGGIRNCSLAAAFQAADAGSAINMEHLVRAVAVEYVKLGRLTVEADFGRFHEIIKADGLDPEPSRPASVTGLATKPRAAASRRARK